MSVLEDLVRENQLAELEPEELAGHLLEHLNTLPGAEQDHLRLYNFSFVLVRDLLPNAESRYKPLMKIIAEAWTWLEAQGLLSRHPDNELGYVFVSRRGKKLRTAQDVEVFRRGSLLGKERLHSEVFRAAWPSFVRGDYETAVFAAFKEVEIAVRGAGTFANTDIGVPLMRKAFSVPAGPLTDSTLSGGEQQAMSDLFAGGIGLFKNPSSHRHVAFSDPAEAAELIGTASYLMRLLDSRTSV